MMNPVDPSGKSRTDTEAPMQIAPDIQLPSLPEITLRALEACHQEESYRTISEIVSADTALVSRILALANSSLYGPVGQVRSIDHALLRLGTHRFHTLVLTAALRQVLFDLGADQWQQLRDFWRHSLTTALTARALATLTRYSEPDQAFMLGMLHNIGELIALKTQPGDARQYFLNHQPEIAAKLVSEWGLGPMASDAMRYQQEMPAAICDAGHLVKLINLATRLAQSDAAGIAAAGTIFGLTEELTLEINRRINQEVEGVASSLGIPLSSDYDIGTSHEKLKQTALHHAIASQALDLEPLQDSTQECLAATVSSLTLITGLPSLYFGLRGTELQLLATSNGEPADFSVTTNTASSLLTEAFTSASALTMTNRTPSVLDRQLMGLLHCPSLVAVPVLGQTQCPGVFIIGTDEDNLPHADALGRLFSSKLSRALCEVQQSGASESDDSMTEEIARQALRRQVHEVSNPLTIIRQYIHQLRHRLEDSDIQQQLDVIREELDRAGDLLLQVGSNPYHTEGDTGHQCNLNEELRVLRELLEDGLFSDEKKTLSVELCDDSTAISAPATVTRQIIINLVRNASECLDENGENHGGGNVTIRSLAQISQSGRTWVELEISDTGRGLPPEVREHLFSPVKSTKGRGHGGLGLSVVKQLVDDMEGIINCRTGSTGTVFRVLFPAAKMNYQTD